MKLNNIQIKELLIELAKFYDENKEELSSYDAVIGDGDHGMTLARGFGAGYEGIKDLESDGSGYFKTFGRSLIAALGGAIGPLFGSIFTELAKGSKGAEEIGLEEFAKGFTGALEKITDLGGAKVGDKTMVDSLQPAVEALNKSVEEGLDLKEGLERARDAAKAGMESTIPLIAKRGRSRYLQEKAIGHQDAGATSTYYLFREISKFVEGL